MFKGMSDMIPAWVNGTLTPVEKLEVHQKGLRHKAVSVFVLDGDRILLQQRARTKYHTPGLWTNTCCTHPGWDETALDCATRRLREELGIVGLAPVHRETVEYRAEVGGGLTEHELVEIFTAPATSALSLDLNPEEVEAVRWASLSDLEAEIAQHPARFTPWLQIYLEKHRLAIFGPAGSR